MTDQIAAAVDGIGEELPESSSYQGTNVLELALPDSSWRHVLCVTYTLERRADVPVGSFRVSAWAATPIPVSCQVSTEDRLLITQADFNAGQPASGTVSSLNRFTGTVLHVQLSVDGDVVAFHLDMGSALENVLSGRVLAFSVESRPLPATRENRQWPQSTGKSVCVLGFRDSLTGQITPPCRTMPAVLPAVRIRQAFEAMRDYGVGSPDVFPLITIPTDTAGRAALQAALAPLDEDTVVLEMHQGNQLTARRAGDGPYSMRFVPDAQYTGPRLLVVETYRLTSVPVRYGPGRVIKTFTLLPGETTTMRVSTYKRSTQGIQSTSSILDATNDESERDFEQSVAAEQSNQSDSAKSFEYNASAEASGSASWGWGSASASVSAGVAGSNTSARQEFAKNLSSAVGKNASRASARREVSVDTSMDLKLEEGEESAVERTIENINVSRTLNFLFRQMNQEFFSVLHLVDIRVGFFSGHSESREEVPLSEMDSLLQRVLAPGQSAAVREQVLELVGAARDYTGALHPGFLRTQAPDGAALAPAVDPLYTSTFTEPGGRSIELPGIIMAAERHVMRTDGVTVDAFLGEGDGLDSYSVGLQTEAVRAQAADNTLKELEAERIRLALQLVQSGDPRMADVYHRVFVRPQIVNQIDHAAIASGSAGDDPRGTAADLTGQTQ
ncbi:hypothetical protein ACFRDV_32815 [Streptomyces fagopyri]|uniref:hypothetical protein n=1 Tax=Streptomyces fagopyri TaxID=2662397 RepID=UPI0036787F09